MCGYLKQRLRHKVLFVIIVLLVSPGVCLAGRIVYGNLDVTGAATLGTPLAILEGGTGANSGAGARANLNVDAAGTDNSTDVTLSGTPGYITITGQDIARGQIDLTSDVTGVLPVANYTTGTPDGTKFVRDDGVLSALPVTEGTAVLSTGETEGVKFLREDGDGSSSWQKNNVGNLWDGKDITWLATSIAETGTYNNTSYPEIAGGILNAVMNNEAEGASTLASGVFTDLVCGSPIKGLTKTIGELQVLIDAALTGSAYCVVENVPANCAVACNSLAEADILAYSFESKTTGTNPDLIVVDHGHNDLLITTGDLYAIQVSISGITNANPAIITTTAAHGLAVTDSISLVILDDEGTGHVTSASSGTGIIELNAWTAPIMASCAGITNACATASGSTITTNIDTTTGFGTFDPNDTNNYEVYDRTLYYDAYNFLIKSILFDNIDVTVGIMSSPPGEYPFHSEASKLLIDEKVLANTRLAGRYGFPTLDLGGSFGVNQITMDEIYGDTGEHIHIIKEATRRVIGLRISEWLHHGMFGSGFPGTLAPLGLGTTNPSTLLDVNNATTNLPEALTPAGSTITLSAEENVTTAALVTVGNGSGFRPLVLFNRAEGSYSAPTAPVDLDFTGSILSGPWDGDSYFNAAEIGFKIDGTVSDGVAPQSMFMRARANGTGPWVDRFIIRANGNIEINGPLIPDHDTVANLPSTPVAFMIQGVTDGNGATDCTTGGGVTNVMCWYNASTAVWQAM